MSRAVLRFAAFASLCAALPASAATRTWPALIGPGCNGTLQQCIDGATAGDTVRIVADDVFLPDAYTLVDENLVIGKSLTLEAAPGIDAVFATGRGVLVDSPTTGSVAVTLRRLVVRNGALRVFHRSAGTGTYTLDQVRVDETPSSSGACAVELNDRGIGAPSFVVGDSTLRFQTPVPLAPSAICASGDGGPWQVSLFRNRIVSERGALFGGISIAGTSAGNVTVSANQLHVHGATRGIVVSQNPGSAANVLSIHDNLVTGQDAPVASIESAVRVNTTNTDLRLVNNTFARNRRGIYVAFVDGAASAGLIANNVVAFNASGGVLVDARYTTDHDNLLFGNGSDGFVPGPGTLTVDPQFAGQYDYRLGFTSPARDAGDNARVATVFGTAFDADGERRIANGTVDLGAFEWTGDQSVAHLATEANTESNTTILDELRVLGSNENIVLTPLRAGATAAQLQENLGVYQVNVIGFGSYRAFHEDFNVDLLPGRRINAWVPSRGATGFLHTSTPASVVDSYSRITHPELDGRPTAIAFVTHNWNPGGSGGIYHDHRLGLDYAAPNWYVGNQDADTMLSGRAFNLVVAPVGSPNAFVQGVGGSPRGELRLEHALLDDNACATMQVGRSGSIRNDTAFSLDYRAGVAGAPGHWFIVAEGSGTPTFPADAAFNVMVSGAQANACRVGPLFTDGFE